MTTLWSLFFKNNEVGSFDHLNWTFDGAFEQLFYWGEGDFKTLTFQKFKCPAIDNKASIAPIKNWWVKVHSMKTIAVIPIKIVSTSVLIIIVQITSKIFRGAGL